MTSGANCEPSEYANATSLQAASRQKRMRHCALGGLLDVRSNCT
jgi:hypothetical protein